MKVYTKMYKTAKLNQYSSSRGIDRDEELHYNAIHNDVEYELVWEKPHETNDLVLIEEVIIEFDTDMVSREDCILKRVDKFKQELAENDRRGERIKAAMNDLLAIGYDAA